MASKDPPAAPNLAPRPATEHFRHGFSAIAALPCEIRVAMATIVARDAVLQIAGAPPARPAALAALDEVRTLCQVSILALARDETP